MSNVESVQAREINHLQAALPLILFLVLSSLQRHRTRQPRLTDILATNQFYSIQPRSLYAVEHTAMAQRDFKPESVSQLTLLPG